MRDDFAFVILCWKRPQALHTLKYLKKIGYKGKVFFAIDNADPTKEEYISAAKEYAIDFFTFDKDTEVSDQMYNQKLKSGAVCTRKVVENVIRDKGIKYFCVLDDDYVQFIFPNCKRVGAKSLNKLIDKYCRILEKIPFVSVMSLAQTGEAVSGTEAFYKKSKFKLKAMNFWFCCVDKPVEYSGIMNDDVNAGILLNKYGNFSIQYGGMIIKQAQQSSGGMKDIYAQTSAMYQKAMFSLMLAPAFTKLNYLKCYSGNGSQRIYHNIQRKFAYPYVVE